MKLARPSVSKQLAMCSSITCPYLWDLEVSRVIIREWPMLLRLSCQLPGGGYGDWCHIKCELSQCSSTPLN